MTQLTPIKLDDGTVIYIQTAEDVTAPVVNSPLPDPLREPTGEQGRVSKGIGVTRGGVSVDEVTRGTIPNFQAIEGTIRAYTVYTLNAFREMAVAEVKKVTLEFGVNVSGVGGIPYIASGTAGCNVKITVECAFPETANNAQ